MTDFENDEWPNTFCWRRDMLLLRRSWSINRRSEVHERKSFSRQPNDFLWYLQRQEIIVERKNQKITSLMMMIVSEMKAVEAWNETVMTVYTTICTTTFPIQCYVWNRLRWVRKEEKHEYWHIFLFISFFSEVERRPPRENVSYPSVRIIKHNMLTPTSCLTCVLRWSWWCPW